MKRRDLLKAIALSPLGLLIPRNTTAIPINSIKKGNIRVMKNTSCPANGVAVCVAFVDNEGKITEFGRSVKFDTVPTIPEVLDTIKAFGDTLRFEQSTYRRTKKSPMATTLLKNKMNFIYYKKSRFPKEVL